MQAAQLFLDPRGQCWCLPVASEQSLARFGFLAVRSSVAARHLRLRMLVAPIPA
jgi:hypothetical protein